MTNKFHSIYVQHVASLEEYQLNGMYLFGLELIGFPEKDMAVQVVSALEKAYNKGKEDLQEDLRDLLGVSTHD